MKVTTVTYYGDSQKDLLGFRVFETKEAAWRALWKEFVDGVQKVPLDKFLKMSPKKRSDILQNNMFDQGFEMNETEVER